MESLPTGRPGFGINCEPGNSPVNRNCAAASRLGALPHRSRERIHRFGVRARFTTEYVEMHPWPSSAGAVETANGVTRIVNRLCRGLVVRNAGPSRSCVERAQPKPFGDAAERQSAPRAEVRSDACFRIHVVIPTEFLGRDDVDQRLKKHQVVKFDLKLLDGRNIYVYRRKREKRSDRLTFSIFQPPC